MTEIFDSSTVSIAVPFDLPPSGSPSGRRFALKNCLSGCRGGRYIFSFTLLLSRESLNICPLKDPNAAY